MNPFPGTTRRRNASLPRHHSPERIPSQPLMALTRQRASLPTVDGPDPPVDCAPHRPAWPYFAFVPVSACERLILLSRPIVTGPRTLRCGDTRTAFEARHVVWRNNLTWYHALEGHTRCGRACRWVSHGSGFLVWASSITELRS